MAVEISKAGNSFKDEKGRRLQYSSWIPSETKAQVVLIHGFSEHMGYYEKISECLCKAGILVHLIDLPGHGRSEGVRGYIEDFDEFADAIYQFLLINPNFKKGFPTFMIGHAMGALVSLRYSFKFSPNLKGIVLLSPLLGLPPAMLLIRFLSKQVKKYAPQTFFPKPFLLKKLSRSLKARKRYISDPYRVNMITPELVENFYIYMEKVQKSAKDLSYPLLCFYTQKDKIVSPVATEQFFKSYLSIDKTAVAYTQAMHELMQEEEQAEVTQKILSWIAQRS